MQLKHIYQMGLRGNPTTRTFDVSTPEEAIALTKEIAENDIRRKVEWNSFALVDSESGEDWQDDEGNTLDDYLLND